MIATPLSGRMPLRGTRRGFEVAAGRCRLRLADIEPAAVEAEARAPPRSDNLGPSCVVLTRQPPWDISRCRVVVSEQQVVVGTQDAFAGSLDFNGLAPF